ncbi:MAG: hypothetical protein ACRER8_08940 [Pseudomonas sp.]
MKVLIIANHEEGTTVIVDLQMGQVESSFSPGKGMETLSFF